MRAHLLNEETSKIQCGTDYLGSSPIDCGFKFENRALYPFLAMVYFFTISKNIYKMSIISLWNYQMSRLNFKRFGDFPRFATSFDNFDMTHITLTVSCADLTYIKESWRKWRWTRKCNYSWRAQPETASVV